MKIVNRRAAGSRQTDAKACRKGGFAVVRLAMLRRSQERLDAPDSERRNGEGDAQTVDVTAMSRAFENGSRKCRRAAPRSQSRRSSSSRRRTLRRRAGAARHAIASIARTEVPAEPAPTPSDRKDSAATDTPSSRELAASAVPSAAPIPPSARAAMPPMIHGVRRPPTSDP